MPDFPPVRFGILGAANIARQFTRGLVGSTGAEVVCVGSRDAEKARAFAAECAIPRSHPSYEAQRHACRMGHQGRSGGQACPE